ncbi:MAG: hypothetical protein KDA32_05145 [Phycisphaerales bacterium]|nr:hypothetical protein [Phycisphaerales bacterium]
MRVKFERRAVSSRLALMSLAPAVLLLAGALACARNARNDIKPHESTAAPAHQPLYNVFDVAPGLISGSAPEGDAGFEELARRGVRTVVSVDGAPPDVAAAHRHGLRYVHLPVGYHGIDRERQLEIARAVRDLPGPVYVHCHHGKHRGPAAAASAAVLLDELTVPQAIALLKKAGTSDHYAGLYECVEAARPASDADLNATPDDFPERAPVPGLVRVMADLDETMDHLGKIRDAGWATPADHPDLAPLAEAGRLENLLRALRYSPEIAARPREFQAMLRTSWDAARVFEDALTVSPPSSLLADRLNAINDSCKACHAQYRDNR